MNKREWMLQASLNAMSGGITDINLQGMSDLYDAIVAVTPDDPAWIEHRGEKPYPEGVVDIVLRDGTERSNVDSDELLWDHADNPGDIVQWRPA